MRVSNIKDFLGGADNVSAFEIIRGEQINYVGVITDPTSGDPLNINSYTIEATAEFYKADVSVTASRAGDTVTINSFEKYTKDDATLTITKNADPSTGEFTVTVPSDLALEADTADLDASTQVLTPVVYLSYNDGGSPATIRKSRLLIIIRHSV